MSFQVCDPVLKKAAKRAIIVGKLGFTNPVVGLQRVTILTKDPKLAAWFESRNIVDGNGQKPRIICSTVPDERQQVVKDLFAFYEGPTGGGTSIDCDPLLGRQVLAAADAPSVLSTNGVSADVTPDHYSAGLPALFAGRGGVAEAGDLLRQVVGNLHKFAIGARFTPALLETLHAMLASRRELGVNNIHALPSQFGRVAFDFLLSDQAVDSLRDALNEAFADAGDPWESLARNETHLNIAATAIADLRAVLLDKAPSVFRTQAVLGLLRDRGGLHDPQIRALGNAVRGAIWVSEFIGAQRGPEVLLLGLLEELCAMKDPSGLLGSAMPRGRTHNCNADLWVLKGHNGIAAPPATLDETEKANFDRAFLKQVEEALAYAARGAPSSEAQPGFLSAMTAGERRTFIQKMSGQGVLPNSSGWEAFVRRWQVDLKNMLLPYVLPETRLTQDDVIRMRREALAEAYRQAHQLDTHQANLRDIAVRNRRLIEPAIKGANQMGALAAQSPEVARLGAEGLGELLKGLGQTVDESATATDTPTVWSSIRLLEEVALEEPIVPTWKLDERQVVEVGVLKAPNVQHVAAARHKVLLTNEGDGAANEGAGGERPPNPVGPPRDSIGPSTVSSSRTWNYTGVDDDRGRGTYPVATRNMDTISGYNEKSHSDTSDAEAVPASTAIPPEDQQNLGGAFHYVLEVFNRQMDARESSEEFYGVVRRLLLSNQYLAKNAGALRAAQNTGVSNLLRLLVDLVGFGKSIEGAGWTYGNHARAFLRENSLLKYIDSQAFNAGSLLANGIVGLRDLLRDKSRRAGESVQAALADRRALLEFETTTRNLPDLELVFFNGTVDEWRQFFTCQDPSIAGLFDAKLVPTANPNLTPPPLLAAAVVLLDSSVSLDGLGPGPDGTFDRVPTACEALQNLPMNSPLGTIPRLHPPCIISSKKLEPPRTAPGVPLHAVGPTVGGRDGSHRTAALPMLAAVFGAGGPGLVPDVPLSPPAGPHPHISNLRIHQFWSSFNDEHWFDAIWGPVNLNTAGHLSVPLAADHFAYVLGLMTQGCQSANPGGLIAGHHAQLAPLMVNANQLYRGPIRFMDAWVFGSDILAYGFSASGPLLVLPGGRGVPQATANAPGHGVGATPQTATIHIGQVRPPNGRRAIGAQNLAQAQFSANELCGYW